MLYDISPADFAHHVRHATSWNDLGFRCGLEPDKFGYCRAVNHLSMLRQKVSNMCLNTDHFHGQKPQIPDDVFKTIVSECDCVSQVDKKCSNSNSVKEHKKILKRIEDLDIDISHFKNRKIRTIYKSGGKLDAIDDETFKTLVNDNTTWIDLSTACGFHRSSGRQPLISRIEKLGLNTNHFDTQVTPSDKIFVVDSQYQFTPGIKKRLLLEFDLPYECAACKNQAFTKSDGVLMWNNKEIVLQLEHKNGIHNDNRIENLEFLCPSCHSQTSTFTGRNGKKPRTMQSWLKDGKTCHTPGSIASLLN
jgi:hypothetical protein